MHNSIMRYLGMPVYDTANEGKGVTAAEVAKIVADALAAQKATDKKEADEAAAATAAKAAKEKKDADAAAAAKAAKLKGKEGEEAEELADEIDPSDDESTRTAKLRRSQARYRVKAKKLEEELAAARAETDMKLSAALEKERTTNNERLIRAEAKAALREAGAHSVDDALRLLDLSSVKIGDNGEVEGLAPLIAGVSKDKAWLFGSEPTTAVRSTSIPRKQADTVKDVMSLSASDYERDLAELGVRR